MLPPAKTSRLGGRFRVPPPHHAEGKVPRTRGDALGAARACQFHPVPSGGCNRSHRRRESAAYRRSTRPPPSAASRAAKSDACIRPAHCLYRLSRYMPPNSWACLYLLEGEEADCQRQEDVQFSGVVQQKHALGEEVGVFEPASSETLVAITTSSRRAESLTEATLKSLHDVVKAGKARISAPPLRLAVRLRPRHRRAPRLDPLRHHAEPRQPALSRGGTRDAAALCRGRSPSSPWSPQARRRLTRDSDYASVSHRDRRGIRSAIWENRISQQESRRSRRAVAAARGSLVRW